MVTPDSALRRLLREAGKSLQPYGFDGSDSVWVRIEPDGVASVRRTRVSRTWTDGAQVLEFGLSLTATPVPWWEYGNWRNARHGLPPVPLEKAEGPGLIDTDGLPDDVTAPWSLRIDPDRLGHVLGSDVDAVRGELPRRVHAYARRAIRLSQSDSYLDELLARPDRCMRTWEAIAVLAADRGPGPLLDDALDRLERCRVDHDTATDVAAVVDYARRRAALV